MAILFAIKDRIEAEAFEHYLMALKLIARTDVHLDISGQVFGEFYLCLDKAVEVYEPPSEEPPAVRLRKVLGACPSNGETGRFGGYRDPSRHADHRSWGIL